MPRNLDSKREKEKKGGEGWHPKKGKKRRVRYKEEKNSLTSRCRPTTKKGMVLRGGKRKTCHKGGLPIQKRGKTEYWVQKRDEFSRSVSKKGGVSVSPMPAILK